MQYAFRKCLSAYLVRSITRLNYIWKEDWYFFCVFAIEIMYVAMISNEFPISELCQIR